MIWTRQALDNITLQVGKNGYHFNNGEGYNAYPYSSLGMGWAYIIIPLVIGILIGGLFIYWLMLRLNKAQKTTSQKDSGLN